MHDDVSALVKELSLSPHPEGGYYRETFRSQDTVRHPDTGNDRDVATSILFLLGARDFSAFHRLSSDEVWYHHGGGTIMLHTISSSGSYVATSLGPEAAGAERFQTTIPRRTWFAAEVVSGSYCLVGCAMAPGFTYEDFELADAEGLAHSFPEHRELIQRLTRS